MRDIRRLLVSILIAAAVPAQAQLFDRNIVVNGGAEDGPGANTPADPQNIPPGWSVTGKLSVGNYDRAYFLSPSDFGPIDRGFRFFYGGASNQRSSATQTIDLSAAAPDIDNSRIKFALSGYLGFLGNTPESLETTNLKVEFLDANGAVVLTSIAAGPLVADVVNLTSGLLLRTTGGYLLPNIRKARITIDLAIESTYYFAADNISLVLTRDPLFGVNQVVNGNAETVFPNAPLSDAKPVPGWNASTTCTARNYSALSLSTLTDPIPPDHGQNLLLCPSPKPIASAYQTVDITAVKSIVDSGRVSYQFSGWLGGPGDVPDNAAINLTFYDGLSQPNSLGSVNLGPVTQQDLGAHIGLQQRSATGFVPVGTRSMKVTLTFRRLRTDALPGMALADNISLVLNAVNITSVVNGASSLQGPVAPGEFVSVYGSGLGPVTGLKSSGGLQKRLGGSTVTFNGIEAYLDYVSATQINAVVPYGISGKADLVVLYGGQQTDAFALALADSSPGIFTQQYGAGQASVVNQDKSMNSALSVAVPGSIIAFWATGQGLVTPAGVDGEVVSGYKNLILPITVTIGGVDAPVMFKGLTYSGVMQVNATVPLNAPGGNVELRLTVGTVTSRTGVTIAVSGPTGAAPQLSSIATVSSPPMDGVPFTFTVTGTNFNPSIAILSFSGPGCATLCSVSSLAGSSTILSGILSLPAGSYTVSIRNGADGAPSNWMSLAVSGTLPSITSIATSPYPPLTGQVFNFTVSGSTFDLSKALVSFSGPGCGVPCTVSGLTGSSTQLNGSIALSTGSYSVTVRNGATAVESNAVLLAVGGLLPSISGITTSPNPPASGQSFTFSITGTNFDPTTALAFFAGPGCNPSCTVTALTGSATQLNASIVLSTGTFTVTLRSGADGALSNAVTLSVSETTPVLTSITTSQTPPPGGTIFSFTISGNNFNARAAIVTFSGPGCTACNVTDLSGSATQLTGAVLLSTGDYTVTVRNGATGTPSNSVGLTVGASVVPQLNTITASNPPVSGQQFNFTISGANLIPSMAAVSFSGPGCAPCTATGISGSATQLNGTAVLSSGTFTVTVRNGATGTPSNNISLTVGVITGPQLIAFTPSPNPPVSGQQFTFTINGANFTSSTAVVSFSGLGCAPACTANIISGSATQLNGTAVLSNGSFTVTVRNGANGTPSNSVMLTVGTIPAPLLTAVTTVPISPVMGRPFSFKLTGGSLIASSAIAYLAGPGCTTPCPVPFLTGPSTELSGSTTLWAVGNFTITVRNGSGIPSNGLGLAVSTGTIGTPVLSNITTSPNSPVGLGLFTFTINGSNFVPSSAIAYFLGAGCTPCIAPGLTGSSTQLSGAYSLAPGLYTVTLRNGTGEPASNSVSLTVGTSATPQLTSIVATDPAPGVGLFSFTITGSNFDPSSALVYFAGPGCPAGCTPGGLTISSTQLKGSTSLSAGPYTLTVRNGASGTPSNALSLPVK